MFFHIFFKAFLGRCFNIASEYWYILWEKMLESILLSLSYLVILISFTRWGKILFTVIRSSSVPCALLDFPFNFHRETDMDTVLISFLIFSFASFNLILSYLWQMIGGHLHMEKQFVQEKLYLFLFASLFK